MRSYDWVDTTCPVCGKNFIPAGLHRYRLAGKPNVPVCSWSCQVKSEKELEAAVESSEWYTIRDIVEATYFSKEMLLSLCNSGELPAVKFNKRWYIKKQDWDTYVKEKHND